jgi:2-polyprenyl-3-methyl-5-hydroxy-6-metoxy-1,4-benzoquinol methylase
MTDARMSFLVVPAYGQGRGGGHLARSAALVRELTSLGIDARLFIPSGDLRTRKKELSPLLADLSPGLLAGGEEDLRRPYGLIVLDRFRTSRKELIRRAFPGLLLGIDEGGPARKDFDFLLDILPGLPNRCQANMTLPSLIPLPKTRREKPVSFDPPPLPLRILVTFGAGDPAGLTIPACRSLLEGAASLDNPEAVRITAILPAGTEGPGSPEGAEFPEGTVRFIEALPDLKEKLASYDLVITHFGLTAFEALHTGTPVLLLSPTGYHEKLARRAGFVSAGIRQNGVRRLRRYIYLTRAGGTLNLPALETLAARSRMAAEKHGLAAPPALTPGRLFAGFNPQVSPVCPVCGGKRGPDHPVLARFSQRTYRRCPRCGMVYMLRLTKPPVEYAEDYFFEFYRRQYGRTYLEDFANLKRAGKIRLHRIRRLLPKKGGNPAPRIFDIGCAYGPFLAAAAEGGFSPLGMDPAEAAAGYVRDRLKIPAIRGFFPDPSLWELREDGGFDAITLWYVIEHFGDAGAALREIRRLLRPGGVLAFSTPSISGVSGRKSLKRFLEKSPGDHVTLWNPRRVAGALGSYGFKVRKIVVTGHHPERFPLIGKRLGEKRGPAYRAVDGLSRLLGLGDTFEVYAVKR